MKWFRSNVRNGARLALLSLFVQLALSFGHSHAFAAPSAAGTRTTVVDNDDLAVQSQADSLARSKQPGKHDGDRNGPDGCAICAVMAMASTMLSATPPLLLLPEAVEFLYLSTDAEFIHLKSAGVAFQPRAPPAS
ncbi:MAG: DUF2946 domain-containing protein [Bradyrhizobium sp.]|nr:DUF2946 domain-containing protein [Bradyrhizobium sp.]